jgi:hypothetical protein
VLSSIKIVRYLFGKNWSASRMRVCLPTCVRVNGAYEKD